MFVAKLFIHQLFIDDGNAFLLEKNTLGLSFLLYN